MFQNTFYLGYYWVTSITLDNHIKFLGILNFSLTMAPETLPLPSLILAARLLLEAADGMIGQDSGYYK